MLASKTSSRAPSTGRGISAARTATTRRAEGGGRKHWRGTAFVILVKFLEVINANHVEIYVSNLDASHAFWASILAKTGYEESGHWDGGFTLSNGEDAYLTFVQVAKKYESHPYHRCGVGLNHLAFKVKSRDVVDALRQYCIDNNIRSLYDEKYPFANGGNEYYALFVEDPDRIKVEFVAADRP